MLYLAKGETVKLGCPYTLEPEDNGSGALGIEWIQLSPDTVHPDSVVSASLPPHEPSACPSLPLLCIQHAWLLLPPQHLPPQQAQTQPVPLTACWARPAGSWLRLPA